jgi:hypothetical protein
MVSEREQEARLDVRWRDIDAHMDDKIEVYTRED